VEKRLPDALAVSSSGKGRLEGFFMGEVSNKLIEITKSCPIWVIKGDVSHSNVLIPLDGSENSFRSVDHAGYMLSGTRSRIILFHANKSLARLLPTEVFEGVAGIEDAWLRKAGMSIEPSLLKARDMLIQAGIHESQIEIKVVDGSRRPAKDILQEAKRSKTGTIVLGRRGTEDVKNYSMGSITRKVLNEANDMAIWIVS
jgi:nucleotide-binding universal stress UspA family protein